MLRHFPLSRHINFGGLSWIFSLDRYVFFAGRLTLEPSCIRVDAVRGFERWQKSDLLFTVCRTDSLKKSINTVKIKLYHNLPSHFENLNYTKIFTWKNKQFLFQQAFCSVGE